MISIILPHTWLHRSSLCFYVFLSTFLAKFIWLWLFSIEAERWSPCGRVGQCLVSDLSCLCTLTHPMSKNIFCCTVHLLLWSWFSCLTCCTAIAPPSDQSTKHVETASWAEPCCLAAKSTSEEIWSQERKKLKKSQCNNLETKALTLTFFLLSSLMIVPFNEAGDT